MYHYSLIRRLLIYLRLTLGLLLIFVGISAQADEKSASKLWGANGEEWSDYSRLPDFSRAGYHEGNDPLPENKITANVRDFGAVGNGNHDDTSAFQAAIEKTERGVIFIPEGRYLITDIIEIRKPNLVLRGAGTDKTTIYCPKQLNDIKPNMGETTSGRPTSNYSWSGGFIWVRGDYRASEIAKITLPASRGDRILNVSLSNSLKVGQRVEIRQDDLDDNSLAKYLYNNQTGNISELKGSTRVSQVVYIISIEGNKVTIDRPLRFNMESRWNPRLMTFNPSVSEVGIEHLRFEFPVKPYLGHFTELGHNAMALSNVVDCWVRDVIIDNSDSGIFVSGRFCTIDKVTFNSSRKADLILASQGHHGVSLTSDDNLLTNFRFNCRFVHDITVSRCAGNVISSGSGLDLSFDHHRRSPYANLWTDIDVGKGTRIWRCGGGNGLGRNSAAWETFWNIRSERPLKMPPESFGPDLMNLIGLHTNQKSTLERKMGKWFEAIPPEKLEPPNLYLAQMKRRKNKL